jgi:Tol biopolymer transport system component
MTDNLFTEIKNEHDRLSRQAPQVEDAEAFQAQIQDLLEKIRQAGATTPPGDEREVLKVLRQFWATYLFDQTGVFPRSDLLPFTGPVPGGLAGAGGEIPATPVEPLTPQESAEPAGRLPLLPIVGGAVLLVAVIAIALLVRGSPNRTPGLVATQAKQTALAAANTEVAASAAATRTAQAASPTPGTPAAQPIPTEPTEEQLTPTLPSTGGGGDETETSTPVPSSTVTPTTPPQAAFSVQLTNLSDGAVVGPIAVLEGAYQLPSGWTVHVLLQPFGGAGRYFPVADPALQAAALPDAMRLNVLGAPGGLPSSQIGLPSALESGNWKVKVEFGRGEALRQQETYNIQLAAALDDGARRALREYAQDGFSSVKELPSTIVVFPGVTTITRPAFEQRVLFSTQVEGGYTEVVSILPDGSDPQIISAPRYGEQDPAVSPDGSTICYVEFTRVPAGGNIFTLRTMDITGFKQLLLFTQENTPDAIERPAWSPDGRYLAYSAQVRVRENDSFFTFWQIFVIDLATGLRTQLTDGSADFRYPTWMPDGRTLVFQGISFIYNDQGLFRIVLQDAAAQEQVRRQPELIYRHPELDTSQPVVSPDGRYLVFVGYPRANLQEGNRDLYLLTLDPQTGIPVASSSQAVGTEAVRLTNLRNFDQFPAWDPYGEQIYFLSGNELSAVNRDGSGLRRIRLPFERVGAPNVGFIPVESR